jgi:hypothetical protein
LFWQRLEPSRKKTGAENPDGYLNAIEVLTPVEDPEALLVRGKITVEDQVSLKPFIILPDSNLDLRPAGEGEYAIVLYDSTGDPLSSWGFKPSFTIYDPPPRPPEEVNEMYFSYRVLWQEGIQRVEIQDPEGRVLASKEVTAGVPEVEIISPNGGETWKEGKSYTIQWQASDPDGDRLFSSLLLSRDGGETWTPLALDLEDTEYELKTHGLPEGGAYLVKVVVTDGINTGEDISNGSFSVSLKGPPDLSPWLLAGLALLAVAALGTFIGLYLARKRGGS